MQTDRFHFTVTDLGRLLGKSPVTLRKWERDGLITVPRDSKGDRSVTVDDVRALAAKAQELGRISGFRLGMVRTVCFALEVIERENRNVRKRSASRRTGNR